MDTGEMVRGSMTKACSVRGLLFEAGPGGGIRRTHLATTLKKRGAETVDRAWGAKESGSGDVWEEHDEGWGPGEVV